MSLIYADKSEESRKKMQYQSKFLMFLSAFWNFLRSLTIFCLCIATWAVSPEANAQKSGTYLPEMEATHAAARRVVAPAGPTKSASAARPAVQDGPNFAGPQCILPVKGLRATLPPGVPNNGPTNVAVTEADVFVAGNGGQANDLCMIRATNADNECKVPHTLSVLPVNDRNYVFDIYPPGTDYNFDHREDSGAFKVFPRFRVLPCHGESRTISVNCPRTCGSTSNSTCVTVVRKD